MFQASRQTRQRAATRQVLGDENQSTAKELSGTTATAKMIKAATHQSQTGLKSKLVPGVKASTRPPTALAAKPTNVKRNALGNIVNHGKPTADDTKPAKPVRATVPAESKPAGVPMASRQRVAARNLAKVTGTNTQAKPRAASSRLASSVPASRPNLRSRASTRSLTRGSTPVAPEPSDAEAPGDESASRPHPMERHDSEATLRGAPEGMDEEPAGEKMDVDEVTDAVSVCDSDITILGQDHAALLPLVDPLAEADARHLAHIMASFEEDIDPLDTTMVPEYTAEIFAYMRKLEARMQPLPGYMDNQADLEWKMRGILVDWLVQVHQRFRLLPETLFLCVNYLDRFLSRKAVSLPKLQLVGTVALLVAAKFEEIQVPSLSDFVYMADHAYTPEDMMKAERFMLSLLNFDMAFPGPMSFLRRISKADDYDLQTRTLAKYLIEVTIMDERFLPYPASQTAAAGHLLAMRMLCKGEWSEAHVYYSGYTERMLQELVDLTMNLLADPKTHNAIYEKYSDRKFMKASIFVGQWMSNHHPEMVARAQASPPAE
ncbi:B-type cyclin [Tieghemiomyces parasiticus]|uniref:B-type cyclin n=1 Tax=Tieghemiomyces parasiticus TaxID=78921 RepID=A0A9W8AHG6_9FUNG|nr:B-type cyclin [Tieghemiomyces parasiticus]